MSGTDGVRQSNHQSGGQREFVGVVWTDNWLDQIGMLVDAHDVSEAVQIVRSFNPDWHVSLWNEEDAGRAR